jgi:hypothetical protein
MHFFLFLPDFLHSRALIIDVTAEENNLTTLKALVLI